MSHLAHLDLPALMLPGIHIPRGLACPVPPASAASGDAGAPRKSMCCRGREKHCTLEELSCNSSKNFLLSVWRFLVHISSLSSPEQTPTPAYHSLTVDTHLEESPTLVPSSLFKQSKALGLCIFPTDKSLHLSAFLLLYWNLSSMGLSGTTVPPVKPTLLGSISGSWGESCCIPQPTIS